MFEWHKKEAPVFTGVTRGVGGFGFGRSAAAAAPQPKFSATGGNLNYSDPQYSFFIFTSNGTFIVTENTNQSTAEVFVVAGGGGGGGGGDGRNATSGGAGGVVFASIPAPNIIPGTYQVVVGAQGGGGSARSINSTQGGNSSFEYPVSTITAAGGGRGADWDRNPTASPGGSGGGYDSSGYSPYAVGQGIQPSQNPGNPHIIAQFGTPGGAGSGGSAGPGALPHYTPGSDFGPTVGAVYPGQLYGMGPGGSGWGHSGPPGSDGGSGIVIVRTKKST